MGDAALTDSDVRALNDYVGSSSQLRAADGETMDGIPLNDVDEIGSPNSVKLAQSEDNAAQTVRSLEKTTDRPENLDEPRTETTGLKKSSEDCGSRIRSQPVRHYQSQKANSKVSSAPDPERHPPTPIKMPSLSTDIRRLDRPRRTSPQPMHQESNKPNYCPPDRPAPTPTASTTAPALTTRLQHFRASLSSIIATIIITAKTLMPTTTPPPTTALIPDGQ
ncbi:hypothetical protein SprV_0602106100 [Sparganum proliferum]